MARGSVPFWWRWTLLVREFACIRDDRWDSESWSRRRRCTWWTRRWTRRSLYRWCRTSGRSSRWWRRRRRTSSSRTSTATRILRTEIRRILTWRRRRRSSLLLIRLSLSGSHFLLEIALDKPGVLLNLVLRDAHLYQILQHRLHGRIAQVNAR